jgi:hypothetical protein
LRVRLPKHPWETPWRVTHLSNSSSKGLAHFSSVLHRIDECSIIPRSQWVGGWVREQGSEWVSERAREWMRERASSQSALSST